MSQLPYLSEADLSSLLTYPLLVRALRAEFKTPSTVPSRHYHRLVSNHSENTELLLMPAWSDEYLAVKLATVFPLNIERGLPVIAGLLILFDGRNGQPLAVFEAGELTARRTAAASALAADYLARQNSERLLVLGSGRLAPYLIEAHASVRPIKEVKIWARDPAKVLAVQERLDPAISARLDILIAPSLEDAVRSADMISTATRSLAPLVKGAWVQPGTHLDLVGGYRPDMNEVDVECIKKALVVVDTYAGALSESGELIAALESGAIDRTHIRADLGELVCGQYPGRKAAYEVTLFKSVGTAIEDLAAATLAWRLCGKAG